MRWLVVGAMLLTGAGGVQAQWEIQDPHVTADLRGIDFVGNGVAWASGTHGTVLRTEDMGFVWQLCAVPPGAAELDFRGVQAFDNETAIVMSSGPGDKSRLYKTTDGCQTWNLVFTNPDKDGFWDAVRFINPSLGFLLGDPIRYPVYKRGKHTFKEPFTGFAVFATENGTDFQRWSFEANKSDPKTSGAFAASNSSMFVGWPFVYFGSGGTSGPRVYLDAFQQHISFTDGRIDIGSGEWRSNSWPAPLASGEAAGIFSIAFLRNQKTETASLDTSGLLKLHGVAVGGDYTKPDEVHGTAASTRDGGVHWTAAEGLPHGYRSAVAYAEKGKAWITVGPNGTDVSFDDGRNWKPLKPGPGDDPDADRNWNALSLPFAVGQHGRIGLLHGDALAAARK